MDRHLIDRLDETIEELILIKYSLLDSSRRLECADGHSGFLAGSIVYCDDAFKGPLYCPVCGGTLNIKRDMP